MTRCQVLRVSRSGYSAEARRTPSPCASRRPQRLTHIQAVYAASLRRYGRLKIAAQLVRDDTYMGEKTVAPWMRRAGRQARGVRRYQATTSSRPAFRVADNRLAPRFTTARSRGTALSPACSPTETVGACRRPTHTRPGSRATAWSAA